MERDDSRWSRPRHRRAHPREAGCLLQQQGDDRDHGEHADQGDTHDEAGRTSVHAYPFTIMPVTPRTMSVTHTAARATQSSARRIVTATPQV